MNIPEQCMACIHRKVCEAEKCFKTKECRERKEVFVPEPKEVRTQ